MGSYQRIAWGAGSSSKARVVHAAPTPRLVLGIVQLRGSLSVHTASTLPLWRFAALRFAALPALCCSAPCCSALLLLCSALCCSALCCSALCCSAAGSALCYSMLCFAALRFCCSALLLLGASVHACTLCFRGYVQHSHSCRVSRAAPTDNSVDAALHASVALHPPECRTRTSQSSSRPHYQS